MSQTHTQQSKPNVETRAWVVAVSMGYGHQRTAYPLRYLAPDGKVINANDYEGIPERDMDLWETSRKFYEFISNFKRIPLIGEATFWLFDQFQKIATFYPRRDLSRPNLTLAHIFRTIRGGWGKDLIEKLAKNPLPLITTFFIPAFMAEVHGYPGDIYCVICDADISRSWASLRPQTSRIKYFAPNFGVTGRLELYGVKKENIFRTGYPLPQENIGTLRVEITKKDLRSRLLNLDPDGAYQARYGSLIKEYLGELPEIPDHPLTMMFSIGGAGAQKERVARVIRSLIAKIKGKEIKVILMCGTRCEVRDYFNQNLATFLPDPGIEIVWEERIKDYFSHFNQLLRKTDILWTKPSELSFYTGLGMPIIMAPIIGSQEDFNRRWLLRHHAGISEENIAYTHEWLFDALREGRLASAAMHGFIEAEKLGTFKIEKIISRP